MKQFTAAIQNLTQQRPLRNPDGTWNLIVVLDRTGISPPHLVHFDQIETAAKQQAIHCQNDWGQPPEAFHTVCVVAHNSRALQNKLLSWAQKGWFQGRYLLLFACGQSGATPVSPEALLDEDEWGLVGSTLFSHQIDISIVAWLLQQLFVTDIPP